MPNDLTAKRNLLNSRADDAPTSQRQKLTSSGFTASIWTISGVVLVACGTVEDFLGLDDGGGGGGRSVHVQSSPVQGARLYFDADDDGTVSPEERAAQDAQYPQGFVTNENGEANGIPGDLYGKAFVAVLDGAFDGDTGESLDLPQGVTEYASIPNANDQHTLASPITDFIEGQAGTVAEVVATLINEQDDESEAVQAQIRAILDTANYQGGGDVRIEALATYLANTQTPERDKVIEFLVGDDATQNPETLFIGNADDDSTTTDITKAISTTEVVAGAEVARILAVSHGGSSDVEYSIVESDGTTPDPDSAFRVDSQGVISVADGATLTASNTAIPVYVQVTDGDSTQTVKIDVTVADAPTLEEVDSGFVYPPVAENEAGIQGGTDLVMGISTGATSPDWVIRAPGGFSDKFDVVADGSNWKLVLKEGEMLDREAFPPNGEISLQVWAVNSGVRSEPLTLTVMVEDANDAPVFLEPTRLSNGGTDVTTGTETVAENARQGHVVARVDAHDHDTNPDWNDVTYAITTDNTDGIFEIDGNGMITVADASMLDYESGTTSYTLTITATDSVDADGDPDTTADDTIMVTINVMDINDESPSVTPTTGTGAVRITDGTPPATATNTGYTITVTDADANNDFAVSVRGDSRFDFVRQQNSDTWDLVLLANQAIPAAELNSEITLTYTVTDGGVGTTAATGTVTLDVVDTPVSFTTPAPADLMVDEGDSAWFLQLTAESVDETLPLADRNSPIASYEFIGDHTGFAIDETTGRITLTGNDGLDYETETTHSLTVRATDSRTPAETGDIPLTVNVQDVNDNRPIFVTATPENRLSDGTEEVDENTGTGTVFAQVRATDDDGTALYNTVTYSITAGNPNNAFAINEDTGEIRVNGALDYEAATFYALTVTASDNQAGSMDAVEIITVNIGDINDESPDVPNHAPIGTARITAVADNPSSGNGVSMGYTVTVTDADADASTLDVSVGGATSDRFEFRRQPNTNTWELYLKAGEAITEAVGALIPLSYTVTDNGIGTNSVDNTFTLEAIDSPIRLADTDGNPVSSYTAPVDEDAVAGTEVVTIDASVDEPAQGSTITYAFVGGASVNRDGFFMIGSSSGEITIGVDPFGSVLDFETAEQHTLTVRVTYDPDSNVNDDQETRDVDVVIDVNNVDETGTRTYEIMQSADPLVVGSMLTAQRVAGSDEDPDGVDEDSIEYVWLRDGNVISGETDATYEITANPESIYTVQVSYLDGYNAALPTAQQTRTEIEASTSPIKFSQAPVDIDEDQGPTKFVTLMPSVDDAGTGHTFSFAYVTGTDTSLTNLFDLGATSGEIKVGGILDRDVTGGDRYVLPITITYDPDGPSSTAGKVETRNVNVVVNVGDVNDNEAEFAASTYSASVAEDATTGPAGTVVFTVEATDDDATPEYSDVSYAIKGGTGMSLFDIDAETGEIRVKSGARLNFDATTSTPNPIRSYSLEIIARDGLDAMGMEALTEEDDTTTVTIRITDVNDNAPNIVVADPSPSVTERTASANTDIITGITVTDGDSEKTYAQSDFALTGDSRFNFVWDATAKTGSVVLTSGSTIAPNTTISLSLTVTDANPVEHSGTDTQALTITVTEKPPLVNGGNTGTATQYDPSAADATGTLTYIDATLVKANPVAGDYTATDGTYGTATVDENGAWTYNVDNTNTAVAALASGATLTDTFTISVPLAAGGTQDADVTITISHNAVTTVDGTSGANVDPTPPDTTPVNPLDRSTSTTFDIIQGGNGNDEIKSGSGGSIIIGGYGQDTIVLGSGADTLIYRFSSIDDNGMDGWRADDGGDRVSNFERGVDKVIFLDQDATAIDLDALLDRDGTSGPGNNKGGTELGRKVVSGETGGFTFTIPTATDDNGPFATGGTTGVGADLEILWKDTVNQADGVGVLYGTGGSGLTGSSVTDYQYLPAWFGSTDSFVGLEVYDVDDFGITISDFA